MSVPDPFAGQVPGMNISGFSKITEPFRHLGRGQFRKRIGHPADHQGIKLIARFQAADFAENGS